MSPDHDRSHLGTENRPRQRRMRVVAAVLLLLAGGADAQCSTPRVDYDTCGLWTGLADPYQNQLLSSCYAGFSFPSCAFTDCSPSDCARCVYEVTCLTTVLAAIQADLVALSNCDPNFDPLTEAGCGGTNESYIDAQTELFCGCLNSYTGPSSSLVSSITSTSSATTSTSSTSTSTTTSTTTTTSTSTTSASTATSTPCYQDPCCTLSIWNTICTYAGRASSILTVGCSFVSALDETGLLVNLVGEAVTIAQTLVEGLNAANQNDVLLTTFANAFSTGLGFIAILASATLAPELLEAETAFTVADALCGAITTAINAFSLSCTAALVATEAQPALQQCLNGGTSSRRDDNDVWATLMRSLNVQSRQEAMAPDLSDPNFNPCTYLITALTPILRCSG